MTNCVNTVLRQSYAADVLVNRECRTRQRYTRVAAELKRFLLRVQPTYRIWRYAELGTMVA